MAKTTQDELYQEFVTIAGQQTSALGYASAMLADVIAQVHEVTNVIPTVNQTQATTKPAAQDGGTTVGSVASTVLASGFGLAPLISGLVSLFTGGDAEAQAPLVKYAMPPAVDFQAAESNSRMTGLDYDQMGMARSYADSRPAGGSVVPNGTAAQASPQITVNVQAMDARSFMDRSNDIALAVREAMLNLHSINDVVNEL